jgi:hypothetical protein
VKLVYTQPEDQDELIDTSSCKVPEIPHGRLQDRVVGTLLKAANKLTKSGARVMFSGIESTMEHETSESRENVKEAYENMRQGWSDSALSEYNDFEMVDPTNPESKTIRAVWTELARAIAANIGVSDAASFQLFSVRVVDSAALAFHLGQAGFGPSVMVAVASPDVVYRVYFAYAREGCREAGVTHRQTHNLI